MTAFSRGHCIRYCKFGKSESSPNTVKVRYNPLPTLLRFTGKSREKDSIPVHLRSAQIDEPVDQSNEHRSPNDISDGHGHQIVQQKFFDGDVRKIGGGFANGCPKRRGRAKLDEQTNRDEIHIRDAMLESRRHAR